MPLNSVGERSSLKPSRCLNKEEQMKIAFHGANAATFRPGIETYLPGSHDISLLSDELSEAGEEQALYEALQTQQIGGAVIDTWYVYPKDEDDTPCPGNLPFHKLNNVVITPHMSGWTWGTIRRRQQVMSENIHRLDEGNVLLNIVLVDNR